MSGIAIYMEGGGDGASARAALRQGMDTFLEPLKQAARDKSWRWRLVCCGSRNEAHRGFRSALDHGDGSVFILLVDAEDVSKQDLERGLRQATNATSKGRYHKIKHASDLLKRIDVSAVTSRCGHCKRLFEVLGTILAAS